MVPAQNRPNVGLGGRFPKHTTMQGHLKINIDLLKVVTNEKGEAVGEVLTIIC